MPIRIEKTAGADPARLARLADDAAGACAAGSLVVAPTETVYGVFAAAGPGAIAALRAAIGAAPPRPHTWHAASADAVMGALEIRDVLHRRLLTRCTPGPVRFLINLEPAQLAAGLARLSCDPGVINDGPAVAVRVPDHPLARLLISRSAGPLVAERLASVKTPSGGTLTDDRLSPQTLEALSTRPSGDIALVLDAGPVPLGRPSTTLRLYRSEQGQGAYAVIAAGAMDPRAIQRRAERLILFVCTGNTCRSPMAEAIAKAQLAARPLGGLDARTPMLGGLPTVAASAGVAAAEGEPQSRENYAALEALGVEPVRHRSRALDREMIREAEVIYTMTRGHARSVAAMDPSAEGKTFVLDPAGGDVPDPIGQGPRSYALTARRLTELVRTRLDSLEQSGGST